jgi:hypothetical protein
MHPAHTKRKPQERKRAMQIELRSGAVRLGPNQTLKVLDGAGSTLCAVEGSLWITEENQPRDIVLEAGGCYRLQHPGVALVNSLAGEASLLVS